MLFFAKSEIKFFQIRDEIKYQKKNTHFNSYTYLYNPTNYEFANFTNSSYC